MYRTLRYCHNKIAKEIKECVKRIIILNEENSVSMVRSGERQEKIISEI